MSNQLEIFEIIAAESIDYEKAIEIYNSYGRNSHLKNRFKHAMKMGRGQLKDSWLKNKLMEELRNIASTIDVAGVANVSKTGVIKLPDMDFIYEKSISDSLNSAARKSGSKSDIDSSATHQMIEYPKEISDLLVKIQALYNRRQKISNELKSLSVDDAKKSVKWIDDLSSEIKQMQSWVKYWEENKKIHPAIISENKPDPERVPDINSRIKNLRSNISKSKKKLEDPKLKSNIRAKNESKLKIWQTELDELIKEYARIAGQAGENS